MHKFLKAKPQNFFEKIFGAGGGTPAPVPAPTPAATPVPAPTPAPTPAPAAQQEEDGLAKFKKLWDVDPEKVQQTNTPIFGDLDPNKLFEAAGKVDFSSQVDNETLSKLRAGGDEAVAAMMVAMNKMAQRAYGQSSVAAAKIAEQAVAKMEERLLAKVPDLVKRTSVSNTLRSSNPLFSRPEVAPIIGALEFQLTAQYPTATPDEISNMAKEYLTGLAKVVTPAPKSDASDTKSSKDDTDWEAFMNS